MGLGCISCEDEGFLGMAAVGHVHGGLAVGRDETLVLLAHLVHVTLVQVGTGGGLSTHRGERQCDGGGQRLDGLGTIHW